MENLHVVDLRRNKLTQFPVEVLLCCPNLTSLDLTHNEASSHVYVHTQCNGLSNKTDVVGKEEWAYEYYENIWIDQKLNQVQYPLSI